LSNITQERPVSIAHCMKEPDPPHIETVNAPKESEKRISVPISLKVEITHPFALKGFSFELTALSAPGTLNPPFFLHRTAITLCFHWNEWMISKLRDDVKQKVYRY